MQGGIRALAALLVAGSFGCGDDGTGSSPDQRVVDIAQDPAVDAVARAPRLEIGAGITEFNEVEDGGSVELVAGPQGGYHFDLAFRFYDVEPERAVLELVGVDPTSGEARTLPIARRITRARVLDAGDHFLRLGDQLVFDTADPAEVTGDEILINAALVEADGARIEDSLRVRVVDER